MILRKLEPLLRKYSPLVKQGAMNWGEMEEISSAEINEILLGAPKRIQMPNLDTYSTMMIPH